MIRHELVGSAQVPDGVELRLMRRGDEFTIVRERNELMNTRVSNSEEALATMTSERLGTRSGSEWLIGGYGMGFTLRAALKTLAADATLTVAEIVPEIIEWARGPMEALTAGCLEDPRVVLVNDDVAMLIDSARDAYDAILLDVDNGPDGLVRRVNDCLYSNNGLLAAKAALRARGILAIWSAHTGANFTQRLQKAGFEVEVVRVRARPDGKGAQHVIWFARKAAAAASVAVAA